MNYSVIESVWLATVAMAYEVYSNNKTAQAKDIHFNQVDINEGYQVLIEF